jgi:hypothetical protein
MPASRLHGIHYVGVVCAADHRIELALKVSNAKAGFAGPKFGHANLGVSAALLVPTLHLCPHLPAVYAPSCFNCPECLEIFPMKNGKAPLTAIRGYAPNKKVVARLVASGLTARQIYEAEKGQTWDKITMRDGEVIGVVDGLRAFGGLREIKKAVERFHGQGATVLDVETGKDSRTHGIAMRDDVTKPDRQSPEYLKLLEEKADARRKKDGKMLKREAYVVWRNPALSVAEKAELTGWPASTLNAIFGRSGAPAGRRPKQAAT